VATHHFLLSDAPYYKYQLKIIHSKIQATERKHESGSRALEEVTTQILSTLHELKEGHTALWECRRKLTGSQNESKEILQEIRQELVCLEAKEIKSFCFIQTANWQRTGTSCALWKRQGSNPGPWAQVRSVLPTALPPQSKPRKYS
jgi:hypothetical protein